MKCNFTMHLEISWHDILYFYSFVNKKQFIDKNMNFSFIHSFISHSIDLIQMWN